MQIRPMTMEDCEQVAVIEAASFSMPWSLEAFRETLPLSKYHYLVAEENGSILGFCVYVSVFDEAEIPNVCVAEAARGKGIGRALMQQLLEDAKAQQIALLHLEVRESNRPARQLYTSLGFEMVGVRKNFYEQPREHAVLMTKLLTT